MQVLVVWPAFIPFAQPLAHNTWVMISPRRRGMRDLQARARTIYMRGGRGVIVIADQAGPLMNVLFCLQRIIRH